MCSWTGEGENMWNRSSASYSLNVQLTHNLDILPSTQESDNHDHSSFIHNIQSVSDSHGFTGNKVHTMEPAHQQK